MKIWKLTNNSTKNIKIGIAVASNMSPGVILKPTEFCYTMPKMTSTLDMQIKRGYIGLEEAENQTGIQLGLVMQPSQLDEVSAMVKEFKK